MAVYTVVFTPHGNGGNWKKGGGQPTKKEIYRLDQSLTYVNLINLATKTISTWRLRWLTIQIPLPSTFKTSPSYLHRWITSFNMPRLPRANWPNTFYSYSSWGNEGCVYAFNLVYTSRIHNGSIKREITHCEVYTFDTLMTYSRHELTPWGDTFIAALRVVGTTTCSYNGMGEEGIWSK